jgi:UDP-N-acetylglucosamine 4,6-dehydratase
MRSVLITGGSGYFGNAFVKRILSEKLCDRVCIYSRGEHSQAKMRDAFKNDSRLRFFIGDVRDKDRMRRAFESVDTVIHAAALKRIEVGISNPVEMCRTNIDGSINVIEAAQDAGVNSVVYLSTDKAWNPVSTYGQTKALSENMFIAANNTVPFDGPKFAVTRYGNVFNSTGSVVPRWKKMVSDGANCVPVTDPGCTRFFMWDHEAVDLVLEAINEIETARQWPEVDWRTTLIPTLPAYRLGDLAEAMCVQMDIIGLPPHEKLHEGMADGVTSDIARRMSVDELREALQYV